LIGRGEGYLYEPLVIGRLLGNPILLRQDDYAASFL
jgi:hypothetical protein